MSLADEVERQWYAHPRPSRVIDDRLERQMAEILSAFRPMIDGDDADPD